MWVINLFSKPNFKSLCVFLLVNLFIAPRYIRIYVSIPIYLMNLIKNARVSFHINLCFVISSPFYLFDHKVEELVLP